VATLHALTRFLKKITKLVRTQKGAVLIYFAAETQSHDQTCVLASCKVKVRLLKWEPK